MKPELIEIVRKLRAYDLARDAYLKAIPSDMCNFLLDNKSTEMQDLRAQFLMEALFGDALEDVYWFLYDYDNIKDRSPHITHADGTEYTFKSDEDYYEYLKGLE